VAESDGEAVGGLERKLATILSADVAGYSRLMAEDEEQTLRTFRGHREVFEKLVALHRGRVFNTAGDAILAEFGSAVEAVRCATEIQAALSTRNDQLPEDRQVRFRIGVNLGDVMLQGEDLLGDGVNVAARLQSAAEPGGICISGSVYDQIRNKLSLTFRPLGDMSFKNIPQSVRTFAIAGVEGLGALPSSGAAAKRPGRGLLIWLASAIALLLIGGAGAGFWSYSEYQRRTAELVREAQVAQEKLAAEQAEAEQKASEAARQKAVLEAERRAAEQARRQAEADRQTAEQKAALEAEQRAAEQARQQAEAERRRVEESLRRLAEGQRKTADPAKQVALAPPKPVEAPPAPVRPPSAGGDRDGIYGGQICYGPSPADPARCFRAQAVLQKGRFSGQWPGRPGVTMYLTGDVTPTGDVTIHMHGKRADGSRGAVMDLAGTLQNGQIDAKGSFLDGRSVTLNWRKD
jgi:class 3 adenylate cyclase/flagellar basal body-associated protein FliL